MRFLSILIVSYIALIGMIIFSSCKKSVDNPSPLFEWYPSIISEYTPYKISSNGPHFPVPLKSGQTKFTEEEVIRYVAEFIDQRWDFIGADSKSLKLVEVTETAYDPQSWRLLYEQITPYNFKIAKIRGYGTVTLSITKGEIEFLESRVIPVVPIPDEAIVSNDTIRKRLIGQKMSYDSKIGPAEYEIKPDEQIIFKDLVIVSTPV